MPRISRFLLFLIGYMVVIVIALGGGMPNFNQYQLLTSGLLLGIALAYTLGKSDER